MVIFSASIRAVTDGKTVTNWRRNSDKTNYTMFTEKRTGSF